VAIQYSALPSFIVDRQKSMNQATATRQQTGTILADVFADRASVERA